MCEDINTESRRGDHILALFVSNLLRTDATASLHAFEQAPNFVRLLLSYSHPAEAHGTRAYKRRHGVDLAPAGLLHCAIPRYSSPAIASLDHLLEVFLQDGVDLDLQEATGNTALLEALFFLPLPTLLPVVRKFLAHGASMIVTNKYGEGCLLLFLRRLSACSIPDLGQETISSIIDLLVTLVRGGCEPSAGGVEGYTPIDAAMSPIVWPIFCQALKEAGRDMKQELMFLDYTAKLMLTEEFIETKYQYVLTRREETTRRSRPRPGSWRRDTDRSCYLCGSSSPAEIREVPFDEFLSGVVDELEDGIHMVMYNHPADEKCLRVFEEDPCYFLDYYPNQMTREKLRERSWRRHVALLMWERNTL